MATLSEFETLSPSELSGSPAWSATFSIDGKYLAVCFGNPRTHVKIWEDGNFNSGSTSRSLSYDWKLVSTIREEHKRTIRSVAFAPTSSVLRVPVLATASFDGKVLIWEHCADNTDPALSGDDDSSTSECNNFEPIAQLEGHESEVKCLAWNATGSLLGSCGRDKTVWVWECFLPGTVGGHETTTMNPMLATEERDDQGEFECLAVLQGHEGDVKSITFGPSHSQWGEGEEILISASYDDTIRIWAEEGGDWYCAATLGNNRYIPQCMSDNRGEDLPKIISGAVHSSTVWCLGLSPGGVRLFGGSQDGSMSIWKMYTASERKRLFPQASKNALSSTDGLWNCVGTLPDAHSAYAVLAVDCAPSCAGHGRIASGGGDNAINIYRDDPGGNSDEPKFALDAVANNAHNGDVNCIKWHPRDGTCLVSCGDDGAVILWNYKQTPKQ